MNVKSRNAWAVSLGVADFVLMSAGLMREAEVFCANAAEYAMLTAALSDQATKGNTFSVLQPFTSNHRSTIDALGGLMLQGVIAFLVGHEIGHHASGHLAVLNHYAKGATTAPAIDEAEAAIGFDSESPEEAFVSTVKNSMEVDADLQGLGFLQSHWDAVFQNACRRNDFQLPEEQQQAATIFEALLRTPRTRLFMTTASVTIGIFLLGFKEWSPTQLRQKSHPLSVVRLLVLIRAAAQRVDGEDAFDLLKNESADALLFIHAVVGWLILRARTMGGDSKFAKELADQPADERLNFLVRQTGMFEAINYSEEIGKHLQELGEAYESVSSIREKAQRWPTESLVRWTNSTQIRK